MPAPLCPEIAQNISYVPGFSDDRSSDSAPPGSMSDVLTSVPTISRLCTTVPVLRTTSEPPSGTSTDDGSMENSVSETLAPVPPSAAASSASLLVVSA